MPRGGDDDYDAGGAASSVDAELLLSDDDYDAAGPSRRGASRGAKGKRRGDDVRGKPGQPPSGAADASGKAKRKKSKTSGGSGSKDKGYAWEAKFQRSWDAVREDEGGSLASAVKGLLEASKRQRTLAPAHAVQRGIIRHLILVLDLSETMQDKDLRPNRHALMLQYAREFVNEFFDQNPIGQLGIVGTRDGMAERISGIGGNTVDHIAALSNRRKLEPRGEPSLQNSLDMARGSLAHLPASNSREILVIFGSLTSCDPGNINDTIKALVRDGMRVSMVSLAAEIKVCKEICRRTGGKFGVVLNEGHFKDLLFEQVAPPEIEAKPGAKGAKTGELEDSGVDLMQMGFPSRLSTHSAPSLCACHSKMRRGGFLCPRCGAKVCDVPTDCPVCGLTVVLSTHLARSYHHLFPVANYRPVSWDDLAKLVSTADERASSPCFSCSAPFPPPPKAFQSRIDRRNDMPIEAPSPSSSDSDSSEEEESGAQRRTANGASNSNKGSVAPSERYKCPRCRRHFCLACDSFVHDTLHVCPGCC